MAQKPIPVSTAPQLKRRHIKVEPPANHSAHAELKMARPSEPARSGRLSRRAMGGRNAIMPMICIDQMPTPSAIEPPIRQYRTWPELHDYCRHSAAPVGRVVLRLFGIRDDSADLLSDDVCVGLQLANFAQDVSVDAARGRTYLLQGEIGELGMAGALRAMCERAAALLRSGRELEASLAPRPCAQVALYRMGGEAILDAIGRARYRTDERRPEVSHATKARLLLSAFLHMGRARSGRSRGATRAA